MWLVWGSVAGGCLRLPGSRVPNKVKWRVEVWTGEEQRRSMSRAMTAESEQLLGVVRCAALTHEEQDYAL